MSWRVVSLSGIAEVPWLNGGGRTRELLAWPNPTAWKVRVSVAEIAVDGPFSVFPGVDRAFAVLDGAGVTLDLPSGRLRVDADGPPALFPGEAAPGCRLVAGPTQDLNLMTRRHAGRPLMRRRRFDARAPRWRGVYVEGRLHWNDDAASPWPEGLPDEGWWLALEAA
jgi:environmental stress-induced protein Ves